MKPYKDLDDATSSRPTFDLHPSRRSLEQLDTLEVGMRVYTGVASVGARHVAAMHDRLRARGLVAVALAPYWFELRFAGAVLVRPAPQTCTCCHGRIAYQRCVRCGTRPA